MAQSNNPSIPEKSLETHADEAINLAHSARQIEVTTIETSASKLKVTARRVGAATLATAAIGVVGISLGGYVADADPEKGNYEHKGDDMVQIESPDSMTPWELAQDIKDKDADLREVAYEISDKADKTGYKGVDAGEIFVLPDEFVSEEAEKLYAPDEEPRQ